MTSTIPPGSPSSTGPLAPSEHVPYGLRVAGEWAWRLLVVTAALALAVLVLGRLELLAVALFVALLLTALLAPLRRRLRAARLPAAAATAVTLLIALAVVAGAAAFVGTQIAHEWDSLSDQLNSGVDDIRDYFAREPWNLSQGQIDQWVQRARDAASGRSSGVVSGTVTTVGTVGEVFTGTALALFTTIFFLHDGPRIWRWFTGMFPAGAREGLDEAGGLAWTTLTGYIRGTVLIALVDALCIGLALLVLGVPLAAPLALLVFLGAFVPIVGALVSGFVAVAVALAAEGVWTAVFVLIAVLAIQQLEGHVLQPLIMGRAVSVHPLAVVLAVAAGSVLLGIVGAVIAVPLVAVVNVVVRNYHRRATLRPLQAPAAADHLPL